MYLAPLCKFMKTVGKTDVYLPLLRVTGIFNITGNVNLRDFTSFHTILISDFENLLTSNKISVRVYEIWQQLLVLELTVCMDNFYCSIYKRGTKCR